MGKKFWKFVILFWISMLIVGASTVLYIKQQQMKERKQFVAQFNYDAPKEEGTSNFNVSLNGKDYTYEEQQFLQSIQETVNKVEEYESKIATLTNNDKALEYMLNAYQDTKHLLTFIENNTVPTSGLLNEKVYEKINNATINYLQASSIYFIVRARIIHRSIDTLQKQSEDAAKTMAQTKQYVNTLLDLTYKASK